MVFKITTGKLVGDVVCVNRDMLWFTKEFSNFTVVYLDISKRPEHNEYIVARPQIINDIIFFGDVDSTPKK